MSNEVFQQNLDDEKGSRPGGPYLIQMLFKEPVSMPGKAEMTAVMENTSGRRSVSVTIKRQQALPPWSIWRNSRMSRLRYSSW